MQQNSIPRHMGFPAQELCICSTNQLRDGMHICELMYERAIAFNFFVNRFIFHILQEFSALYHETRVKVT